MPSDDEQVRNAGNKQDIMKTKTSIEWDMPDKMKNTVIILLYIMHSNPKVSWGY